MLRDVARLQVQRRRLFPNFLPSRIERGGGGAYHSLTMEDTWDPRMDSVKDAVDQLQRNFDSLSVEVKQQVYYHVMECGTWEQIRALREWLARPTYEGDDVDPSIYFSNHQELYRCAVVAGRFDMLQRLLAEEKSGEELEDLLRWAYHTPNQMLLSQELVIIIKEAPSYRFIDIAWWFVRNNHGLDFLREWVPEAFEISDQETISEETFQFICFAMKRQRMDILKAIEEQIPSEDFFRNEWGGETSSLRCWSEICAMHRAHARVGAYGIQEHQE